MEKSGFQLNSQLLADSHDLLVWQGCHVRLHKNATLPWVILIPETNHTELHDLPTTEQIKIMQISQLIGGYFKQQLGTKKINFAAIGNVVKQLHIHVIGRHPKDPLWPDVVWGQTLPNNSYQTNQLEQFKRDWGQVLGSIKS